MNKYLTTTIASIIVSSSSLIAASVDVGLEAATYGLAGQGQTLLTAGVIEVGWLTPGTTQAQIQALFLAENYAGIDALFNQVAVANLGNVDFDSGGGQYFKNVTVVADGDTAGLSAYKNASTGAAGKDWFSWVRDSVDPAGTTQMAFVDGVGFFPTANDTNNFTDFGGTFAHSVPPAGTEVWVGSFDSVILGSQIDNLGAGNAAGDGFGATGSGTVLQLAAVPEPSSALLVIGCISALGFRRSRRAQRA